VFILPAPGGPVDQQPGNKLGGTGWRCKILWTPNSHTNVHQHLPE